MMDDLTNLSFRTRQIGESPLYKILSSSGMSMGSSIADSLSLGRKAQRINAVHISKEPPETDT